MPEVMRRLRNDHRNIARLLSAIEHQLAIFDRGEQPDYDVLAAAADYFLGFPDLCHHPSEDLIFRKLREKDPAAAQSIGDLEAEHQEIALLARHFHEAVQNVLEEVEVSRCAFDSVIRHFIGEQRQHMEMEEERFFPLALGVLTPEDWAEIDAQLTKENDPLFGSQVSLQFKNLRNGILRWEEQDEANEH
jgi:hemerythrin-like domain-containing protein